MEQRAHGFDVWREPLVALRVPKIFNLRSDPFERATKTPRMFYDKWMADRAFLLVPAQAIVGEFLKTFKEFPPRQKPASFSIDEALEKARQRQAQLEARLGRRRGGRGGARRRLAARGAVGARRRRRIKIHIHRPRGFHPPKIARCPTTEKARSRQRRDQTTLGLKRRYLGIGSP